MLLASSYFCYPLSTTQRSHPGRRMTFAVEVVKWSAVGKEARVALIGGVGRGVPGGTRGRHPRDGAQVVGALRGPGAVGSAWVPTEPQPITLFEIARRAVEIADPSDVDARLGDLLAQFEDADEPVTAIQNLEERVAIAVEGVDVEIDDPAVSMAAATILYLARRRDELHDEPDKILRLAARAEWKGDPPEAVRDWLADRGVEV